MAGSKRRFECESRSHDFLQRYSCGTSRKINNIASHIASEHRLPSLFAIAKAPDIASYEYHAKVEVLAPETPLQV